MDEKIKLQEAKRLNIRITGKEIRDALKRLERRNNLPPGGLGRFLSQFGLDRSAVVEQIESEIAWIKIIRATLLPRIKITEEEVEERLAEIKSYEGKPLYRVAEIFIPVDDPSRETEARLLSERLIQELQGGARFAVLARSFSKSPSAEAGGDLGWIRQGELDRQLDAVIATMNPRDISPLIRTATGYYILTLINRRIAEALDKVEVVVSLQQIYLNLPPNPGEDEIKRQMERGRSLASSVENCADMDRLGKETGSPLSGNLGKQSLGQLSAVVRDAVKDLPVGGVSQPIRTGQGVIVLMVCDRSSNSSEQDARDRARRLILEKRLGRVARRRFEELRRAAHEDVRL